MKSFNILILYILTENGLKYLTIAKKSFNIFKRIIGTDMFELTLKKKLSTFMQQPYLLVIKNSKNDFL